MRPTSSIEIPLRQDDRYVLYTDGLLESTNAKGEEFDLPRCKQFLESHFRLAPAALADELIVRSPNGPPALQAERRRMT